MVHTSHRMPAAVAVALVAIAAGCGGGTPARVHPPNIDPSEAGKAAIRAYDKDGDGNISGEEFDAAPALKAALENLDANGDGAVASDEIRARIDMWIDSKLGLHPVAIQVYYRDAPLEGATVKLVPCEFLGAEMAVAEGTTGPQGYATPAPAGEAAGGVPPGLYRVEIRKDGLDIPPQYNSETTLGLEVALDSVDLRSGAVVFRLQ
jgi:hypothetical protein